MKVKILLTVFAAVCFMSCSSTHYVETQSRMVEPTQGMLVTPVVADVELISSTKIEPFQQMYSKDYGYNKLDDLKALTIIKAAKRYNADVLVAPIVEVDYGKNSCTITVTGYPARYVNLRAAKPEDSWISNMYGEINGGGYTEKLSPKISEIR